jgi:DNA topoisomerase VI subunit B
LPKTWLDKDRITEVVINIIGNAIKYTEPPGKIEVKAHTDGDKIVVSIEDNGRGIPKDRQAHIFEKFAQGDVLKDQVKGTGLGMFITKNLIELHKGKVWFKSTTDADDHGTTFYFTIPILKEKPFDPHEGEGALFQTGKSKAQSQETAVKPDTKPSNEPKTSLAPSTEMKPVSPIDENKKETDDGEKNETPKAAPIK